VRPQLPVKSTLAALAVCLFAGIVSPAIAQDIEPRAYSNAPVGVNFLIAGYAYTRGGVSFDTASPLSNPELTTSSAVVGFARVLEFRGQSAKFDVVAPLTAMSGSAEFDGEPLRRDITGLGDPKFRLSVNFFGAPALSLKDFAGFKQDLIVGASLQVSAPAGQYDESRLVNLGTNRWSFKPELGVSKALGRWTLEGAAAVTLFTDNEDYFQGKTRSQDPIYSLQGHVIYGFPSGVWAALNGTYFAGGRTALDDTLNNDLQQNWRVGATLAFPVNVRNSIKLYGSSGVSARTGNSYELVGMAWQYRWGGGL
jgi:hypothetical protein